MRWPQESAIIRRDDQLARTRRLSIWIAGGAAAASVGLAAALGSALPGHSVTSAGQSSSGTTGTTAGSGTGGTGTGQGSGQGSGSASGPGRTPRAHHRRISAPRHAPAPASAPPVVSSGGS